MLFTLLPTASDTPLTYSDVVGRQHDVEKAQTSVPDRLGLNLSFTVAGSVTLGKSLNLS